VTLGQSIKLMRSSAGVKQRQLAAKLGVSSNYISLLESGKREPSISFLRRLSQELAVPMGIFFLWQEFDSRGVSWSNIEKLRDVIVRLEAMQFAAAKGERRRAKKKR
jgi:transcriptional regulator with XRE-family HTH domain